MAINRGNMTQQINNPPQKKKFRKVAKKRK